MGAGGVSSREAVVLRQSGAVLVPVAVWVFCAFGVVDAVVEGTPGYAVRTLLLMAAIAFAAWLVLASPCLVVESEGLRIVNPTRVHWIPFSALEDVRVRGLTSVTARRASGDLQRITAWNGPGGAGRDSPPSAPPAVVIERYQAAWEGARGERRGDTPGVETSWRGAALVLLLLVVTNIAIWLHSGF